MRRHLLVTLVAAGACSAAGCGETLTFDDVHVNRPPTLSVAASDAVEGGGVVVSVTAADPDGNRVEVSYASDPPGWVTWAAETFTGGEAGETKEHARATGCEDLGPHDLVFSASDGLVVATEWATVEVRHAEVPPGFDRELVPSTSAWVGTEYSYRAKATSANDCDEVLIKLQDGPPGMTIRRSEGESRPGLAVATITWTPSAAQSGAPQNVALLAEDAAGQVDSLGWQIVLSNRAPVVTESPPGFSHWKVGLPGERFYEAVDDDGHEIVRWDLLPGVGEAPVPDGMQIAAVDADTGRLTWAATAPQVGEHSFAVVAIDSELGESAKLVETAYVWKDDDRDHWCDGPEPVDPSRRDDQGWCNGFGDCDEADPAVHEGCN